MCCIIRNTGNAYLPYNVHPRSSNFYWTNEKKKYRWPLRIQFLCNTFLLCYFVIQNFRYLGFIKLVASRQFSIEQVFPTRGACTPLGCEIAFNLFWFLIKFLLSDKLYKEKKANFIIKTNLILSFWTVLFKYYVIKQERFSRRKFC